MVELYVFGPDDESNDYATKGLCGDLLPTSTIFHSEANAESSVTMVHPLDEYGKYTYLENGNILSIPVPVRQTPEIQNGEIVTRVYQYEVKPEAELTNKNQRTLYKKEKGTARIKILDPGTKMISMVYIPEIEGDTNRYLFKTEQGTGYMTLGGLRRLNEGQEIIIGNSSQSIESVLSPWSVKNQQFRIYSVKKSIDSVSVEARHISYDLLHNITEYKSERQVKTNDDIQGILGNCISPHSFKGYTSVGNVREGRSYRGLNPINAFFDEENGVCARFDVSVIRDNHELYFLHDPGMNRGVRIEYGRNMTGVDFEYNDDEVYTRFVPVGELKDGTRFYLDDKEGTKNPSKPKKSYEDLSSSVRNPKIGDMYIVGTKEVYDTYEWNGSTWKKVLKYIDSPKVGKYPFPRVTEITPDGCKIGEKDDDGSKVTASVARARMRAEVQRLIDDGTIDEPTVSMSISFQNLGRTEEYSQFQDLEKCYLYDYVRIIHKRLNLDTIGQIIKMEWDCLLQQLTEVEIGTPSKIVAGAKVGNSPDTGVSGGSALASKNISSGSGAVSEETVFVQEHNSGNYSYSSEVAPENPKSTKIGTSIIGEELLIGKNVEGDVWLNGSDGNTTYLWNGEEWKKEDLRKMEFAMGDSETTNGFKINESDGIKVTQDAGTYFQASDRRFGLYKSSNDSPIAEGGIDEDGIGYFASNRLRDPEHDDNGRIDMHAIDDEGIFDGYSLDFMVPNYDGVPVEEGEIHPDPNEPWTSILKIEARNRPEIESDDGGQTWHGANVAWSTFSSPGPISVERMEIGELDYAEHSENNPIFRKASSIPGMLMLKIKLLKDDWVNNEYRYVISELTGSPLNAMTSICCSPDPSSIDVAASSKIVCSGTEGETEDFGPTTFVFSCKTMPTVDVIFNICLIGGIEEVDLTDEGGI